jgi:GntR family transcriptional regulator
MFMTEEAAQKLRGNERERFLRDEWPAVLERIQRLGCAQDLLASPAPCHEV